MNGSNGTEKKWQRMKSVNLRRVESTQSEQQRMRLEKIKQSLRDLWDNDRTSSVGSLQVSGGEENNTGLKGFGKKSHGWNFPNLAKDTNLQIKKLSKLQTGPRPSPSNAGRCIKDFCELIYRKVLEGSERGTALWLTADFLSETMEPSSV